MKRTGLMALNQRRSRLKMFTKDGRTPDASIYYKLEGSGELKKNLKYNYLLSMIFYTKNSFSCFFWPELFEWSTDFQNFAVHFRTN